MRLLYHDSHYNLIQMKKGTRLVEDTNLRSTTETSEEGESNPCEVPRDCDSSQRREGLAVKYPPLRFHWSENSGKSQEQSSRRRSESMKKHGWTTQEGQTTDKGKPVAVPPEPRPLRFQRPRGGGGSRSQRWFHQSFTICKKIRGPTMMRVYVCNSGVYNFMGQHERIG